MKALRPWLVPALLVLAALVAVWSWNRAGRLSADLDRAREAAGLRAAGLEVERDAARRDLAKAAAAAVELQSQLAAARQADPGVRVVEVVRWRTRPEAAGGEPREPNPPTGDPPKQEQPIRCLLAAGDLGEVRVVEAQLRGSAGSRVVVGSAEAWRLEPGPPARLFGGPLRAPVEQAIVEAERPLPRWGAGVAAFAGRDGWALGPAVALPPLRLWGLQGEAVLGAGAGPSGAWQAGGSAILRW